MVKGEDPGPRSMLLSKDTESEGIVITSGSCHLMDASFSNAAERLAGLELDLQEDKVPQGSPSSSRGRSRASQLTAGSSKSLRTNSTRSLASISEMAPSSKSGTEVEYEQQLESLGSGLGKSDPDTVRYSEEINYRSPFGYPDAQQELSDRDDRLDNAGDYLLGNSRGGHQLTDTKSTSEEAGQLRNGASYNSS